MFLSTTVSAGVAAEGETLLEHFPGAFEVVAEAAVEDGQLGGFIPDKLARLCAKLDYCPLLHYHHALPFVDGDDGAVGNDVVGALGVGASVSDPFLSLHRQHVAGKRITVEILSPLIPQKAAHGLFRCLYESHLCTPLSNTCRQILLSILKCFCLINFALFSSDPQNFKQCFITR